MFSFIFCHINNMEELLLLISQCGNFITTYPKISFIYICIMILLIASTRKNKLCYYRYQSDRKLRKKILSGNFISYKQFEKKWIINKAQETGYKYHDRPGCYIITIYDRQPYGNWKKYKNIYIGQSVHIYQRVHNHFTGKGKGDVYADIKRGKYVYVRFLFCSEKWMNTWEKRLIKAFHATDSYNETGGGGKRR